MYWWVLQFDIRKSSNFLLGVAIQPCNPVVQTWRSIWACIPEIKGARDIEKLSKWIWLMFCQIPENKWSDDIKESNPVGGRGKKDNIYLKTVQCQQRWLPSFPDHSISSHGECFFEVRQVSWHHFQLLMVAATQLLLVPSGCLPPSHYPKMRTPSFHQTRPERSANQLH